MAREQVAAVPSNSSFTWTPNVNDFTVTRPSGAQNERHDIIVGCRESSVLRPGALWPLSNAVVQKEENKCDATEFPTFVGDEAGVEVAAAAGILTSTMASTTGSEESSADIEKRINKLLKSECRFKK